MPIGQADTAMSNGQDAHASPKKGKQKKAVDSNESAKLLAQRISQLEQESAGEKDQEAEIGMWNAPLVVLLFGAGRAGSRVSCELQTHDTPPLLMADSTGTCVVQPNAPRLGSGDNTLAWQQRFKDVASPNLHFKSCSGCFTIANL